MSSCSGSRYWRRRIRECMSRENERFGRRMSTFQFTMPPDVRKRFVDWHLQRQRDLRRTAARWGKSAA